MPQQSPPPSPTAPLVAGVDVGGTFTDAVVLTADGPRLAKVPTTPSDQGEGLVAAVEAAGQQPTVDLQALAHGTTTATNAVLERTLDRAVLLVTEGFADVLTIARQNRPSLYDLSAVRPAPTIPRDMVVPVPERITVDGEVLTPLTDAAIEAVVARTVALQPDAVAICLLFGWADPSHEHRLATAVAAALPDVHITVSADLVGSIREYERASTCALNAAVGPTMGRYLQRLSDRLPDTDVTVMTSGGGTADLERMVAEPVHTLLSGPAGGVVAAAAAARSAGFDDAIAFDMGGTSTDVCLIRGGEPVVSLAGTIDGLPIGTSTIGIHTVGAGGGSIASLDAGGALRVGPRSAGSDPGPACYGRGGTLPTVTDAHAVLGHLDSLAGGTMTADVAAAERAIARIEGVTATGILDVVRAAMARALRRVSTEAGVDPDSLALVAYGGAGPLHASALARMLGCRATVLAPAPGVLSAVGLLTAPQRREWSRTVMVPPERLRDTLDALPLDDAVTGSIPDAAATVRTVADLRYVGQAHELRIDVDPDAGEDLGTLAAFHRRHEQVYGYALHDADVVVVTVRRISQRPALHTEAVTGWDLGPSTPTTTRTADLGDGPETVSVVARGSLRPGDTVSGPAVLVQPDSTGLLLHGDVGTVDDHLNLVIRHG